MTEYARGGVLMLSQGSGPPHPAVPVDASNPVPVSVAALPLPSGGATSALQGAGNTSLAAIATNTTGLATATGQTANGTILGNILTKLGAVVLGAGSAVIGGVTQSGSWVLSAGAAIIGKVGIDQTTPGATNGVIVNNGSTGLDYSANKPTLPTVGSAFAASGPYASYVLVATVPASSTRANVDIENDSGAQIAIVRDDGTAAGGAAPVNASVFPISGGAAAGQQGGSWSSSTFRGRLQIYAPVSTVQVAVMVE